MSEERDKETQAQLDWHKLRSTKGWVPESVAMILYEFIQHEKMFTQLIKFAKGRK